MKQEDSNGTQSNQIENLTLEDLGDPPSLKETLRLIENRFITLALEATNGMVTPASKILGFKHHQSLISILDLRHHDAPRAKKVKRRRTILKR